SPHRQHCGGHPHLGSGHHLYDLRHQAIATSHIGIEIIPNQSLGRVMIFYITSCGLSAFIRCLLLVFNE
ncbi:MAG: hypothetical protein SPJ37_07895, partial [Sodaliphilus sp.]|nr:hypothetical protein [Sodaliphilus sp.]